MDEKPLTYNEHSWMIFTRRFQASRGAVFKVAEYLNREKNCEVCIPAMRLAPNSEFSDQYKDGGDIIANGKHIVEVKGTSKLFYGMDDFPFEEIMIVNVQSADRYDAYAYFIVNSELSHAAIVRGSTKNKWTKKFMPDKEKGGLEEKYLIDKRLAEFVLL